MAAIPKGNLYAEVRRLKRELEEAHLKIGDLQRRVAQLEINQPPAVEPGSPFYPVPIYPTLPVPIYPSLPVTVDPGSAQSRPSPDTFITSSTCAKSSS